jgi:asparagine synthase (glutamine-hydrolysing)
MYTDEMAGLASTRLSIIDLSGGDQPIHNEDRSIWVVYNGEIFNYPELREDLVGRGHRFYTKTDTEILVHLYEERGPDLFQGLNGQFSLALWDRPRKRLLLARDRLGVRPLFYHRTEEGLFFGSEIKALFADPRVPRSLDLQTLKDVFTCWAPLGSATAFQGVEQLPPGHYALFSQDGMVVRPYWQLSFGDTACDRRSEGEWVEDLKGLLHDATRIRLRADVPVGAYLSGGLDSTYITSVVNSSFDNQLRTFSVSFTNERFDEAPFQEQAVRAMGTDHRSVRCTDRDIGEIFPEVVWHAEVPMLRTAPAPLFLLSGLVRENGFKVVLTGEGSDEIFAGYDIFKEDKVRRFWARRPDSSMRPRLLGRLYPDIFSSTDGRSSAFITAFFGKGLSQVDLPAYSHLVRWENTAQTHAFLSPAVQQAGEGKARFLERFTSTLPSDFMGWDPLSRAQYTEIRIFLSNYLLSSQGDRVGMAHAVEGRFPFLDYRVVELACRMPPRLRMKGLKDKYILRKAAADLLPREVAWRPKQPYRAPISGCFLGDPPLDYAEELLSQRALQGTGCFHPKRVEGLLRKCRKQDGRLLSERENMALVGIISTQLLYHQFISNFPPYPIHEPENVKTFTGEAGEPLEVRGLRQGPPNSNAQ